MKSVGVRSGADQRGAHERALVSLCGCILLLLFADQMKHLGQGDEEHQAVRRGCAHRDDDGEEGQHHR